MGKRYWEQDIHTGSEYYSKDYLLIIKRKESFTMEKFDAYYLNQMIERNITNSEKI